MLNPSDISYVLVFLVSYISNETTSGSLWYYLTAWPFHYLFLDSMAAAFDSGGGFDGGGGDGGGDGGGCGGCGGCGG